MTAVGKILVFFVLVFSVITAGLIVVDFSTSTNWKRGYDKMKETAQVAEAAYKNERAQHEVTVQALQNQISTLTKQAEDASRRRDEVEKDNAKLKKDLVTETGKFQSEQTTHETLSRVIETLKAERDKLTTEKQTYQKTIGEQQIQIGDLKVFSKQKEIEAAFQSTRAGNLLTRVAELEKQNSSLKNQLVRLDPRADTSPLTQDRPVPPPPNIQGSVLAVGKEGLMVTSLGSDSGVSVGNKLYVYRPDPPTYLGEVTLTTVQPKQSSGQFRSMALGKGEDKFPKTGDSVVTSLSSK